MLGMKLEETFSKPRKFKVVKVPVDENEYTEKLSEEHGVIFLNFVIFCIM